MMWFVSRRRYDAELAAAQAETERIRGERDRALKSANRWHGTASRTSELFTDTSIVNDCLTRDLSNLKRRHDRVLRAAARYLAAFHDEKRHAAGVQQTLDVFLGLDHPAVAAGETWQDRREQKMRYDA